MKLADLNAAMVKYVELRTRRLDLYKQSAAIKSEEDMLRSIVLKEMMGRIDKHGTLYQPEGLKVKAEVKMKAEASVVNWDDLWKHIQVTGEFDLLHKSVTVTAVRQRWEVGKEVPGVKQTQSPDVTISKVKE